MNRLKKVTFSWDCTFFDNAETSDKILISLEIGMEKKEKKNYLNEYLVLKEIIEVIFQIL